MKANSRSRTLALVAGFTAQGAYADWLGRLYEEERAIREDLRANDIPMCPMRARAQTVEYRESEDMLACHDSPDMTYEEIGAAIGVSGSRAQAITMKALRKLRHPSRVSMLLGWFRDDCESDEDPGPIWAD